MMGNVAGVSQLLETVGTVGPQAAPQSVPVQNFAAVMQQTSGQEGSPLPAPLGSFAAQQNAQQQGEGSGATGQAQQSKAVADSDASLQLAQRTKTGQTFAGARAATGSVQVALGLPVAQTAVAGDVAGNGTASVAMRETGTPVALVAVAPKVVAPKAEAPAVVAVVAAPVDVAAGAADVAATLKVLDAGAVAAPATGTAKRSGEAKVSLDEKQVGKAGSGKADSKLTASIPQGTAQVPQMDAAAAAALVAPVLVAAMAPVELPKTIAAARQGTVGSDVVVDLAAPVAAPLVSAASAQGTGLKQVGTVKAGVAFGLVQASTPGAGDAVAAKILTGPGSAAAQATVATGKAGQDPAVAGAVAPPVAPHAGSVLEFASSLALAAQSAQGLVGTSVAGPTASAQAAGPVAASVGMTGAKPGVHGERNGIITATGLTAGVETAVAGANGTPTTGIERQGSPASTPVGPAVPVAALVVTAAVAEAAVVTPKAALQGDETGIAPVAVPPRAAGPVAVKSSSLNGAVSTTAAKDAGVPAAVAAPAIAPVVAGAAAVAVVSVPAVVPVPLAHGTSDSASVSSTSAPVVAGSGSVAEAEGQSGLVGGSLPHTTLSATPTSLEVGVSSGTHGWLKIRAELNAAGGVDASLTGATAEATSRLRGDLPALSSYLQDAKVAMGTLDVRSLHVAASSFESGAGFSQGGSGQGGAGQPGTGQNGASQNGAGQMGAAVSADAGTGGGQARQGAEMVPVLAVGVEGDKVLPGRISDAAVYGSARELAGSDGSPSAGYGAGGGWLNVRA